MDGWMDGGKGKKEGVLLMSEPIFVFLAINVDTVSSVIRAAKPAGRTTFFLPQRRFPSTHLTTFTAS